MVKKIISFLILFILFFGSYFSVSYADMAQIVSPNSNISEDGVMPLATFDDYEPNADGSYTLSYTHHAPTAIYKGSVNVPAEFWGSDPTYKNWCMFISNTGVPVIFASTNSTYNEYYFAPCINSNFSSNSDSYLGIALFNYDCSSATDSIKGFYYKSGSWVSYSGGSGLSSGYVGYTYTGTISPSGFCYFKDADVYFTSYYNANFSSSSFRTNLINYIKNGTLSKYSAMSCTFYGTSPSLLLLNDNTFKVALGTCYPGYTFESSNNNFVNVTNTVLDTLFIYIYDVSQSTDVYKYALSYDSISDYLYDSDKYGKVLELPFDTAFLPDFFESGHKYTFLFSISCINTVSKGGWTYKYYDSSSFSSELVSYGSGGSTGSESGGTGSGDSGGSGGSGGSNTDNSNSEIIETNKGIWETIKEILSYLNPFSENFFAYKLVELIYNALSDLLNFLFVPSNDFLANWFNSLNNEFSDQFGIIYFPVDVSLSFLNTLYDTLSDSEPIINIPEFRLSFMGYSATIIEPYSYNFNDLLSNDTFKQIHNLYKMFVNLIFIVGLIAYACKIGVEIFGGVDDSINQSLYNSQADVRAYNQVRRQSEARKAYQRNGGK